MHIHPQHSLSYFPETPSFLAGYRVTRLGSPTSPTRKLSRPSFCQDLQHQNTMLGFILLQQLIRDGRLRSARRRKDKAIIQQMTLSLGQYILHLSPAQECELSIGRRRHRPRPVTAAVSLLEKPRIMENPALRWRAANRTIHHRRLHQVPQQRLISSVSHSSHGTRMRYGVLQNEGTDSFFLRQLASGTNNLQGPTSQRKGGKRRQALFCLQLLCLASHAEILTQNQLMKLQGTFKEDTTQ